MLHKLVRLSFFFFNWLFSQQVASLEHETEMGRHNSIVQVDSDTYALAYSDENEKGWIATFTITSNGSSITEITSLKHNNNQGLYNSLTQVDSDTYLLAYTGPDNDGFISSFTISSDGTSINEIVQLEHQTSHAEYNSLVQVDSDTYALAYSGPDNDGFITTFTVPSDGSSITKVATIEHNTSDASFNSLIQVDSDTYLLGYTGSGEDGFIATFTISSDGASITEVSELEHQTSKADYNSLEKVDSDTYALAYSGPSIDGFITTFTVPSNGSTITEIATIEHNTSDASFNSLIQVDPDTYVLAYSGTGENGFIATFTISSNGATITEIDEIEHDTEKGRYNSIVQVDSDTYALAYAGLNSDGFIKTFSIQSDGTLPVELTSFELLETRNNGITLQWITESEINNLGFNLDRKTPITNWSQIASYVTHPALQGQGSVSHQTIYTFTDNTVQENESYDYRLSDVDYYGNVEYHSLQLMGVSSTNIPEQFILYPNYPNPFNPVTTIRYDLSKESFVDITIYDMLGNVVSNLINANQSSGYKSIQWNATNNQGKPVSAGVYLYSIEAGKFRQTKKMILLK